MAINHSSKNPSLAYYVQFNKIQINKQKTESNKIKIKMRDEVVNADLFLNRFQRDFDDNFMYMLCMMCVM